jgi:hypothetical protein
MRLCLSCLGVVRIARELVYLFRTRLTLWAYCFSSPLMRLRIDSSSSI